MSRFYASIKGNRGEATRQGTCSSGIIGHIRGWDVGASVVCYIDNKGRDRVIIHLTGGSRGAKYAKLIGDYTEDDLK